MREGMSQHNSIADEVGADPSSLNDALLVVRDLIVRFPIRAGAMRKTRGWIQAVDGVSFSVGRSETLGLVGESGCGKSTTARAIAMLTPSAGGHVQFDGIELTELSGAKLRAMRRNLQVVFQDPHSSLDSHMRVQAALAEPLAIHRIARGRRAQTQVAEILEAVGLRKDALSKYPHEFSGGQRQRIAIARALMTSPKLLICDEPVSALDVSVQAQTINLLGELQASRHLSMLFIAHDVAVVRHLANRIAVMYLGEIVEIGPSESVCARPLHPYTKSLISAVPSPDPHFERSRRRIVLQGEIPSPADPPSGCRFHTRCPFAQERCAVERPRLEAADGGHLVSCHYWRELAGPALGATPGKSARQDTHVR
jgi:oligopeptide/dipeptide ABC transporter ATP-binding protein